MRGKIVCAALAAICTLVLFSGSAKAAIPQTGFLDRMVVVNGSAYRYQVYVPPSWTQKKKWPVILFLHGAGERGDDGKFQTTVGLGKAIREHPERFPAIAVFPQSHDGKWWTDADMEALALSALEAAVKEFHGDRKRVYLTGLSMGGYGTWSIASRHPKRFAALVPICGGIREQHIAWRDLTVPAVSAAPDPYTDIAERIVELPVWIFHGEKDDVIPASESRSMYHALLAFPGHPRYTEYHDEPNGHHVWDRTYDNPKLWRWVFAQRRPTPVS